MLTVLGVDSRCEQAGAEVGTAEVDAAVAAAIGMGVSPRPVLMSLTVASAGAFLTPIATPTNLMVMSPGRYTLRDFVRAGLPVALVFQAVALVSLPVFFPFGR